MACLDTKDCFVVDWKISNFSFVSSAGIYPVRSPVFKTESENDVTWWRLLAYNSASEVEFRLTVFKGGYEDDRKELSIMHSCGEIQVPMSYVSQDSKIFGFSIQKDDVFKDKKLKCLPNDTLTVRCRIWQKKIQPRRCGLRTALHRVHLLWSLDDFSIEGRFMNRTLQQHGTLQLILYLYKKPDSHKVRVELQPNLDGHPYFVNCELSTKSSSVLCLSSKTHYPCTSWIWDMESFYSDESSSYLCLVQESLVAIDVRNSINSTASAGTEHFSTLKEDLLSLHRRSLHSDVIFNTKDKSFPAHKSILSARSEVFRAMFENDQTSESLSGIVNIEDIDEENLERMLVFLYSDTLEEDLQWEDALFLYYAADKYAIISLKLRCAAILKVGLTVSNVCHVLLLAHSHSDEELIKVVVEFICDHDEVLSSAEWVELEDSNAKLTTKIMREIYMMQRVSKHSKVI